MGTSDWQAVGWLLQGQDGKPKGYCETCQKMVTLRYRQAGEYESYSCADCGETVLDD